MQRRLALLLLALCIVLNGTPAALAGVAAQSDMSADSAITVAASPAYGGVYRPGSWLPVRVELQNSGVDRSAEVRIGSREGAQYAAVIELPNGARKSLVLYVYLPGSTRRLNLSVRGAEAELFAGQVQLQPAASRARTVGVISTIGTGAPPEPPARLPDGTPVVRVPLALADLPEHPLGLSTFDTLVIEDVPAAELNERQRAAMQEWVLRGGQLLVGGGQGLARTLDGLPTPLRPANVAAVESVPASSLLGPSTEGVADLPLARLIPQTGPDGRQPYAAPIAGLSLAGQPLVLEQSYGRGVVSMVAAPLGHPAIFSYSGKDQLWADLLRAPASLPNGFAPDGVTPDGFIEGQLASTLTNLPALEFPPLLPLGLLLGAYILLVGPGVYLLLRRLDRQALGWVLVPLVTLVFAGAAYGLGYAQRGGDVVVNQVSLVEPLVGTGGLARVRSFAGLFSPSRMSYQLGATDTTGAAMPPLLRPISLQGPWDTSAAASAGVFVQEAGAAAARDFEVAQWSMRAIATDTIGTYSGLEARVIIDGEKVQVEVTNRGQRALEDVTVVQGERLARLGNMAPGATASGELTRRQNVANGGFGSGAPLSYIVYGEEMDRNSKSGGQPLPPELQLRIRLLDSYFAYGPAPRDGQPTLIAWSREPGLAVQPVGQKAELQHMALITAQPQIELAGATITLGQGWLTARFDGSQANVCYGSLGSGVTLGNQPIIANLVLPRDLYGLRPSALTLVTAADGPWPADASVELYDWASGSWESVPAQGKPLAISEPARFLSSHGRLRVRLGSSVAQPNTGCLYIDAKLEGSLS